MEMLTVSSALTILDVTGMGTDAFPVCTWRMMVVRGPFLSSRSGLGMPLWGLRLSSSTASLTTPQNQSVTRLGEK